MYDVRERSRGSELRMSAIMLDILHILMSPPPVPGCVYLPLFTAHFIPKPSQHQQPGVQSTPGLWDEEAKGGEYKKLIFSSVHFIYFIFILSSAQNQQEI